MSKGSSIITQTVLGPAQSGFVGPVPAASGSIALPGWSEGVLPDSRNHKNDLHVQAPQRGEATRQTQGKDFMSDREVDQQLVERAQRGDKRAFELLVLKYQRKLERLLSRVIRDPGEVEDVAQEAFIKAYRALPNFRGDSAFYTWLYRIGINTAKNYLISLGRRAPTSTEFDSEEAESFEEATGLRDVDTPEAVLMTKQIARTVNETIDALPEELRTAITLREIDGLSYEEIAQIMNCPIGTVRSRIFRAREAVAEKLRPQLGTSKDRRW